MNIKTVIFDMDGVIFDSERVVMDCWKVIFDKYGYEGAEELCYRCAGMDANATAVEFRRTLGQDFPFERLRAERSEMYFAITERDGLPLKSGVKELLSYLAANGYRIGLASSTRYPVVEKELKTAGLFEYFDQIITGDMVTRSKPEPDIYLLACERLNVNPHSAYAIEDSYNGIRSSHAAGMHPIMVPDLVPADAEMRSLAVTVEPDLIAVLDYIKREAG